MLNYIWACMVIFSIICSFFTKTVNECINAGLNGAANAVSTVIALAGMMCLWSGLMAIGEAGGIVRAFSKLLRPLLKFLFPDIKPESKAAGAMVMNMTANIFGLGNSATPLGLTAMQDLDEQNGKKARASNSMCTFVVLNTASIQLLPTTVIALRANAGSAAPSEIIVPVWIASIISVAVGLTFSKILEKRT